MSLTTTPPPPLPPSTTPEPTSPCPASVWRSRIFPDTGPHEAEAGPSPFSTNHTAKAVCGHLGNANRISFTLASTISHSWPPRPFNIDRRIGCPAVRAWGPLSASSPATRGRSFWLPGYSYCTPNQHNADSPGRWTHPACHALTSGARIKIIFYVSSTFLHTFHSTPAQQFASNDPGPAKAGAFFCSVRIYLHTTG